MIFQVNHQGIARHVLLQAAALVDYLQEPLRQVMISD